MDFYKLSELSVDEQARAWLLHLYSGQATEQHKSQFVHWLKSSQAHATAYKKAEACWRDIPLSQQVTQNNSQGAISRLSHYRKQLLSSTALPFALAASLIIAVINLNPFSSEAVDSKRYTTAIGEIEQVQLSDGSAVYLAANSALEVAMSQQQRRVTLLQGAAYFDVESNPSRPFVVTSDTAKVTVVGTEFEVRLNQGGKVTKVAVAEGAVKVSANTHPVDRALTASATLVAGERVTMSEKAGLTRQQNIEVSQVASWKLGRLSYVNERLEAIIEDVNRYRSKAIVIASPALKNETFTTVFSTDNTDELLSTLQQLDRVKVTEQDGRIVIELAR